MSSHTCVYTSAGKKKWQVKYHGTVSALMLVIDDDPDDDNNYDAAVDE